MVAGGGGGGGGDGGDGGRLVDESVEFARGIATALNVGEQSEVVIR